MDYADIKTKREIITPEISREKFASFLKEIGLSSIDEITHNHILLLLKTIVNNYKSGKISLDEMSSAFNLIHSKTIYDNNFQDLNDILESGSDLSYYERISVEDELTSTEFVNQLRDILKLGE